MNIAKINIKKEICLIDLNKGMHPLLAEIKNNKSLSFNQKTAAIRKTTRDINIECRIARKERYNEYLKSIKWDTKRKLALKRAKYSCEGCEKKDTKLEVHHNTYDRVGFELLTDLNVYCDTCHELAHGYTYDKDIFNWKIYIDFITDAKPNSLRDNSIEFLESLTEDERMIKMVEEI